MIKSFIGIGLFSIIACCVSAQQQDQPASPGGDKGSAGLLGKNYVDFGLFTEHFRNIDSKSGYGTGIDLNLPAMDNFDVGLNYAFERVASAPRLTENTLGTSFTGYFTTGNVKPFADLDFGYAWQRTKLDTTTTRNDRGIYGAGAGLEVPVTSSTALAGRAVYDNSFRKGSHHERVYTASVAQNITDGIAAKVNVSFHEKNSTVYDLGVVFFF
jgi:hypothetical protein